MDTVELNHEFGGHILQNVPNLKVDVKKPDINMRVEVRKEAVYISCQSSKGQEDYRLVPAERQC